MILDCTHHTHDECIKYDALLKTHIDLAPPAPTTGAKCCLATRAYFSKFKYSGNFSQLC